MGHCWPMQSSEESCLCSVINVLQKWNTVIKDLTPGMSSMMRLLLVELHQVSLDDDVLLILQPKL